MISNKLKNDSINHNMIELGKRFIQCLCLKSLIYEQVGQKIEKDYIQSMCTDVIQTVGKKNKNDEQDFISWIGEGFCANDEEKRRQIQQYIESILKQIKNKSSEKQLNLSSLQLQQNDAQAEYRRVISMSSNKFQNSFNQKDIKLKNKIDSYSRRLQEDQYAYPKDIDVSYYLNNKIKSKNTQLSVLCQQFGFIKTSWKQSKQDNMFVESISVMIDSTETLILKKRTVFTEGKAKNKQTAKQMACHDALLQIYMNCPGVYSSMIDKKTRKAINT